jgi:hypothetical protein
MATTDAKSGFRLPWSPDRNEPSDAADSPATDAPAPDVATPVEEIETPLMIDAAPAASDHVAAVDQVADTTPTAATAPAVAPARKPNKFMADLGKAMQAAAESARTDTLERFGAEAKTHIEGIHAASANEATDLRKRADDDVASIREWSKAEIARIREETDERITHRKSKLDQEIEGHAALIEHRIELVQARVAQFEAEMAAFFELLVGEPDPTRFAAMAENLPEPPAFDSEAWSDAALIATAPPPTAVAAPEAATEVVEPTADVTADVTAEAAAAEGAAEPVAEAEADAPVAAEATSEAAAPAAAETTPDADLFSIGNEGSRDEDDPRLSALGLTPDFAAAEAEAAAFNETDASSDDEIPVIADDALAARLAGLVPETADVAADAPTTRVIVLGLVSVASIAGFKRQMSRIAGVHAVGVSSGPDGEFVFSVTHDASVSLRDTIPGLTGFGARVTGDTDGDLQVTARDPESEG